MKIYWPLKLHWRGTDRSKQVRLLQNKVKRVAEQHQAGRYEVSLGRWKGITHQASSKLARAVRKAEPTCTFHMSTRLSSLSHRSITSVHAELSVRDDPTSWCFTWAFSNFTIKPFNCWQRCHGKNAIQETLTQQVHSSSAAFIQRTLSFVHLKAALKIFSIQNVLCTKLQL